MALLAITESPRIVACGGPITKDVYKSHATQIWEKGALLTLASGLLLPIYDATAGVHTLTTTEITAGRYFIALEHHLTAGSVFVAVQEVDADTLIELQVCNSQSSTAGESQAGDCGKGTTYAAYALTGVGTVIDGVTYSLHGRALIGLDVGVTSNGVMNVIDTENNYKPHQASSLADYSRVKVKMLASRFVVS